MSVIDFLKNQFNKQSLKQRILSSLPTPQNFNRQIIQPVQQYFQPTPQLRTRDVIRELPQAATSVARFIAPAITENILSPRKQYQQMMTARQQGFMPYMKEAGRQFLGKELARMEAGSFLLPVKGSPSLLRTMGRFGGVGAGYGALNVAGQGLEQKRVPTAKELAMGVGTGAALGAALPLAAKGAQLVGKELQFAAKGGKRAGFVKLPGAGDSLDALRNEAMKYKSAQDFIDDLHGDVSFFSKESPKNINLDWISVQNKGQGKGTQVMQDLFKYADSKGKTITLYPENLKTREPFTPEQSNRLIKWYESLGFQKSKKTTTSGRFLWERKPQSLSPNKGVGAKKLVPQLTKAKEVLDTRELKPLTGQLDALSTKVSSMAPTIQKGIQLGRQKSASFAPNITQKLLKVKGPGKNVKDFRNIPVKIKYISDIAPESVKDITGFDASFKSVYRNLSKSFGKGFEQVKRRVLDPFDAAKGQWVDDQVALVNDLKNNIVKKLGIQKGSKESALVQRWGEKGITLDELKQATPKWREVIVADEWFRQRYDNLLEEVNAVRKQIYPNNPNKIIPRREDYYRHFQELEGVEGLKNLFEGPSNIPTELAGISDYTEPRAKFLSFAQKRLGGGFKEDAVGGYLDYIRAQTYAKNIDPHISNFRNLANELRDVADKSGDLKKASRLTEYLEDFANDLAGKTNPLDRSAQKITGRKFFRAIDWINRRVKLNVILGNLSSAVAQFGNTPQAMAHAGYKNWASGFYDTIAGIGAKNKPIDASNFIKERYFNTYNQFDTGIINSTKKMAAWITRSLDELGTKASWNGFFRQALEQKIPNPVLYADDLTRQMVAGRGVGEVPLVQKSKVAQLFAPFQIEVQNLWHVLGKDVGEKKFGTLLKYAIAAYGFNQAAERLRGNGVTFDPIRAVGEAYGAYQEEEDKKIGGIRAGGRLAGEVLSNVMGGQTIASLYPEYGKKIPGTDETITRKELFGREDPTRFGSGLVAFGAAQDPLYKLIPGFGGQQIKRTIQGLKTVGQGYAESGKKVQTPVGQDLINWVKGATFGKSSLREVQDFYKNEQTALSEKQSAEFKEKGQSVYDQVMKDRLVNDQKEAVKTNSKKNRPEEIAPGVFKLANDKFYTYLGGEWKTLNTQDDLTIETYKQEIRDGKRTGFTYNGTIYYKASDGSIRSKKTSSKKSSSGGSGGGGSKSTKVKKLSFTKPSISKVSIPTVSLNVAGANQSIGGKFAKLRLAGGKSGKQRGKSRKGLTIRQMV